MKNCNTCNKEKTLENFSKNKATKDGFQNKCKACEKEYYQKTLSKRQQQQKERYNPKYLKEWKQQEGSGVYGIFEMGKCLYVGESEILKDRISKHHSLIKNPEVAVKGEIERYKKISKHSQYVIGILEKTTNHKEREAYYINKYKPKYNTI